MKDASIAMNSGDVRASPDRAERTRTTSLPAEPERTLTTLPDAVLKLGRNGKLLALNDAGDALIHQTETVPEFTACLRELIERARNVSAAVSESIEWTAQERPRLIQATVLPLADGIVYTVCRDASLETSMRTALIDSRQRFKDLVEISSDFAWETDLSGRFTFVSTAGALDYQADALIGRAARDLVYHTDAEPDVKVFEAQDIINSRELWLKRADGNPVCVLASARPVLDGSNRRSGARGVCRDITAERLREDDLARLKVRHQVIAYIVDAVRNEADPLDMLNTAVSSIGRAIPDTACAVFRRTDAGDMTLIAEFGAIPNRQLLTASLTRTCQGFQTHVTEVEGQAVLMTATQYRNDMNGAILLSRESRPDWNDHERSLLEAVAGQLGIALRQIENQSELERLSRTDALTGLFNRRAFMEELQRALERGRRNGQSGAVFFVDLNNFKAVNDVRGHDVGDKVLSDMANILKSATRSYDFVARLGGGEFAMWFENIDKDTARRRGQELLRNSRHLEALSGTSDKRLGLSIGIAMFRPGTDEDSDGLLKRADAAMYRAKHSRKRHLSLARDKNVRDAEQ